MKKEDISRLDHLPQQLRSHGQFCLWKYEVVDGRQTKVPYNPKRPSEKAATNRPDTFSTFETASRAAISEDFSGVGIRVSQTLTAIDIDHCFDEDGKLSETAKDIITRLNAYTEKSPSGKGLHIYFTAKSVEFSKEKYYIKHGDIEVYIDGQTNRYLTVTGDVIRDSDLVDRSSELQGILTDYMTRESKDTSDRPQMPVEALTLSEQEIIDAAINSRIGTQFQALFNGQWQGAYPSQSEADQAFCNMLAFWTRKDPIMIDSIFRKSRLYRDKWNREDYRTATIDKAIASTTDVYTPKKITAAIPDPTDADAPIEPGKTAITETVVTVDEETEQEHILQEPTYPTQEDIFKEFEAEIDSNRFEPISTGIDQLDAALDGGLERRTLLTLAAAPGAGKTAIAQYIFENMAKKGHPVIYVNLEMDRSQLLSRSLSRLSYEYYKSKSVVRPFTAATIKRGYKWTNEDRESINYIKGRYKATILPNCYYVTTNPNNSGHIDNTLSAILKELERITNDLRSKGQTAPLVCIDYLQFIEYDLWKQETCPKRPDNADAIKQTLKALKSFAMKYDTVVLVITANNRVSNSEGRASMDSGRDTSNIEYSGDVMLSLVYTAVEECWLHKSGKTDKNGNDIPSVIDNPFIYRVIDYAKKLQQEDPNHEDNYPKIAKLLTLKVVKFRNGESRGSAKFVYEGKYYSFDVDHGTPNPYWSYNDSEPD